MDLLLSTFCHEYSSLRLQTDIEWIAPNGDTNHNNKPTHQPPTSNLIRMPVTAADIFRSKRGRASIDKNNHIGERTNVDEEIQRLEADLQQSIGSSDDSDDTENDELYGDQRNSAESSQILNLSKLKNERIDRLSAQNLPSNSKRTLKIDRKGQQNSKKLKGGPQQQEPSGLEAAVKEVLDGYVPRSAEKLPFYCRYCSKQLGDKEEWTSHQYTEFHKKAVAMERKRTYCKLCRKQLTSIVQMNEHLKSRPHRQELERRKGQQRRRIN